MNKKKNFAPICTFIVATIFFISCEVNSNNSDGYKRTYYYEIESQTTIAIDTVYREISADSSLKFINFSIEEGLNKVFKYKYKSTPPKGIADGGFSETLVFEIPDNISQFEYKDEELKQIQAMYRQSCYCSNAGIGMKATKGVIRGNQINLSAWKIYIDVKIKYPSTNGTANYEVSVEKVFNVE